MINDLTKLGGLVASLGHDLGHRGRTNDFEISSYSELSVNYNDKSPLENYHCTLLFEILKEKNSNILERLPGNEFRTIRRIIIECILATDMKKHKKVQKIIVDDIEQFQEARNVIEEKKQVTAASFVTHVCDLSGAAKKFEIASQWSELVRREFIQQVL